MTTLRRILMAVDFSDYSNEAVEVAVYLAQKLGGEIYLLHVFELPFYPPPGMALNVPAEVHRWVKEVKEEESKRLNKLTEEIRKKEVPVHPMLKEGVPFLDILKTAEEIPADLIVLGTHGRTGVTRMLIGSVAQRVSQKARCPVLTVRPKALSASPEKKGA